LWVFEFLMVEKAAQHIRRRRRKRGIKEEEE
jgi:hypothetical protein